MNHHLMGCDSRVVLLHDVPLKEIDGSLASGSDWGMSSLGEFS
jgi:hypothetical protein